MAADVACPADEPAGTLIFLGDRHTQPTSRAPADALGAVTLTAGHVTAQSGIGLLEWAADHGGELGRDPERMILAELHAGACVAAGLALHARDEGWQDSSSLGLLLPRVNSAIALP